jgi:4'-phosphopantetheinyl transferase
MASQRLPKRQSNNHTRNMRQSEDELVIAPWIAPDTEPLLRDGEIHVWAIDLDVDASWLSLLESTLTDDEITRADRYHYATDRSRFVAARGQLRAILGRYTGVAPSELQFSYSKNGKPSLAQAPRVRFNLSGSDSVGMIAVREGAEVGIDVERIRGFPEALAVARRMLTHDEFNAIGDLPEVHRVTRFFEYWARKEAVVKSRGLGVWQLFDRFFPDTTSHGEPHQLSIAYGGEEGLEWIFPLAAHRPGFVAALSTGAPAVAVRPFLPIEYR